MKVELRNNRDLWAGLTFVGVGLASIVIASRYPFGNALRMGPGYFPIVLGGVLILFGVVLGTKALRRPEAISVGWSPRALIIIPLAMVMFGVLMQYAGFIPALAVLIVGSAAASREFKLLEVALLTVVLTVLCVVVFIWGLSLPYPLLAGF